METLDRIFMIIGLLLQLCHKAFGENVYCTGQRFEATCHSNQVIVINKAIYGREKQNRCVTSEQGLGCFEDVIMQFDHKCSGKQTCQVVVGDADIATKLSCHGELRMSLDIEHSCTKVLKVPIQRCDHPIPIRIQDTPQMLSSTNTPSHCDLRLETSVQQAINITLIDFDWNEAADENDCVLDYGKLIQGEEGEEEIKICGGGPNRVTNLHISNDNWLELQWNIQRSSNFLLQVAALSEIDAQTWLTAKRAREDAGLNGKPSGQDESKQINMPGLAVILGGVVAIAGGCIICTVGFILLIKDRCRSQREIEMKAQHQKRLLSHRASAALSGDMQSLMMSSYIHPAQAPSIQRVKGHYRTRSVGANSIIFQDKRTSGFSGYEFPDDEFSCYYDEVAGDTMSRSSIMRPRNPAIRSMHRRTQSQSQAPRVQSFTFPNMQQSACSGYEEPPDMITDSTVNPLPIPKRGNAPSDRGPRVQSFTFPNMHQSACSGYEEPMDDSSELANQLPIPKRGAATMGNRISSATMHTSMCSGYEEPIDESSECANQLPIPKRGAATMGNRLSSATMHTSMCSGYEEPLEGSVLYINRRLPGDGGEETATAVL